MDAITKIAEEKIRQAIEEGELNNIPGAGKPIVFEDETWIPEDLRLAYRVLKNAGCIPPELELRKEIITLRDILQTIDDDQEKTKRYRELNFKIMQFNMMRKRPLNLEALPEYEQKVFGKQVDNPGAEKEAEKGTGYFSEPVSNGVFS